jgi:HPt (histidine-containing phosphotransfer) domain-containing protein
MEILLLISFIILVLFIFIYKRQKDKTKIINEETNITKDFENEIESSENLEEIQEKTSNINQNNNEQITIKEKEIIKENEIISKKEETVIIETKEMKNDKYGKYDTTRAINELGLSEEDLEEFLEDLILQIEEEMELFEKHIEEENYKLLKSDIHKVKGSCTNLGEGGIAQLLIEFDKYLSTNENNKEKILNFYKDFQTCYEKLLG